MLVHDGGGDAALADVAATADTTAVGSMRYRDLRTVCSMVDLPR
jgi:hypothetical protein